MRRLLLFQDFVILNFLLAKCVFMKRYLLFVLAICVFVVGCDNPTSTNNDDPSDRNRDDTTTEPVQSTCSDGVTENEYPCKNVELVGYVSPDDLMGSLLNPLDENSVILNDIWGWTDSQTNKEYALVGLNDGVTFVDISQPSEPVVLGKMPKTEAANPSTWRDIKVYENHAYVVADDAGPHGMQVFDLKNLRDASGSSQTFEPTTTYNEIYSAHNVVINSETGYAYVVGSNRGGQTCGSGLHMVNIQDPANPTFEGCFADPSTGRSSTGYTHDAQCVTYHGPDSEHEGEEICFGSNETAISIANVSDKQNPQALSTASYPGYGYVHQGWLTEDQRYFLQDDELDENSGGKTTTYIWDLQDLDNPEMIGMYEGENSAIDHNQYIKGNYVYQSNYTIGLRILSLQNVASGNLEEVAYFDTFPEHNSTVFNGSWSNYPFFESGLIIASDISNGLFILQPNL